MAKQKKRDSKYKFAPVPEQQYQPPLQEGEMSIELCKRCEKRIPKVLADANVEFDRPHRKFVVVKKDDIDAIDKALNGRWCK